jgi:very-short-patch-repair endonuclease
MENINWELVQKYYDEGNPLKPTAKHFGISEGSITYRVERGLFKTRTPSEASKLSSKLNPRKLSQDTKDKISKSRKKYLIENPDKVPYLLNHSSKESYPEKYFNELFEKEKINVAREYRILNYSLDFAILNKKIDIEIDGEQHNSDPKVVENDRKRDEYLESENWTIIRIKWSYYKKLSIEEKKDYVKELISYIDGLIEDLPTFEVKEKINGKSECKCGKLKCHKAKQCNKCRLEKNNNESKINSTNLEELLKQVKEFGYCGTGRIHGVSYASIRKWIEKLSK